MSNIIDLSKAKEKVESNKPEFHPECYTIDYMDYWLDLVTLEPEEYPNMVMTNMREGQTEFTPTRGFLLVADDDGNMVVMYSTEYTEFVNQTFQLEDD